MGDPPVLVREQQRVSIDRGVRRWRTVISHNRIHWHGAPPQYGAKHSFRVVSRIGGVGTATKRIMSSLTSQASPGQESKVTQRSEYRPYAGRDSESPLAEPKRQQLGFASPHLLASIV
jgi:hypothetical protein